MLKVKIIINSKKYDVNGNPIFNVNVKMLEWNKQSEFFDITNEFTKLSTRTKVLKNGSINIQGYKNIMIKELKSIIQDTYKYTDEEITNDIEVIEK